MWRYVAKLQKWSNYNELHRFDVKKIKPTQNYKSDLISMNWDRFDVKTIKNVEVRRKTFKTTENYKTDQLQWIALTWGQNDQKQRKTTKVIKLQWIASIWHQNDQNVEVRRKTTKVIKLQWIASIWRQKDQNFWVTSQNNKSDQIIMNCIDLTSNDQKCWDTSQNIQNYAKLRKSSNYNELHRFDVKKIKSTQNYKSDLISMNWIDLTSKRSKRLSYATLQK